MTKLPYALYLPWLLAFCSESFVNADKMKINHNFYKNKNKKKKKKVATPITPTISPTVPEIPKILPIAPNIPKVAKIDPCEGFVHSVEEVDLYGMIMSYREEHGLKTIPLSPSLSCIAELHCLDQTLNFDVNAKTCTSLHSWSDRYKTVWSECCVNRGGQSDNRCIHEKPQDIIPSYSGLGFEISYWRSPSANAASALQGWKNSRGHNDVILNQSGWANSDWVAIGVGIHGKHANVWFGRQQ